MAISRASESIAAGDRDKWVTIEAFTEAQTGSGYPGGTWAPLATVAMSKFDGSADERVVAAQPSAFVQTTWVLPYRPDMDPDTVDVPKFRRLLYGTRRYDITAATNVGRRRKIELVTLAGSKAVTPP